MNITDIIWSFGHGHSEIYSRIDGEQPFRFEVEEKQLLVRKCGAKFGVSELVISMAMKITSVLKRK